MNCPSCNADVPVGMTHTCAIGRNCPACSQFIPAGGLHNCAYQPQMQTQQLVPMPSPDMTRVATALEGCSFSFQAIATNLGKLAAVVEQRLEFEMSYYTEEPEEPSPGPPRPPGP